MDERTYQQQANEPVPNSGPVDQPIIQYPANDYGDVRQTNANQQQQASQQQMNTQAQQQASQQQQQQRRGRTIVVQTPNGQQEVDFYPAPQGHASQSMYRLSARAREQERTGAKVDVPASATNEAFLNARVVPMPAGGIHSLVSMLYPDDVDNQDAFDAHVYDILTLNRDTLRDDTSSQVGAIVRVPA